MRKWLWGFVFLTTALWLFGLWLSPPAFNARAWVHELFFVTGVLAWGLMALCLVIANRPAWLERVAKTPLDALYVHHRVIGWWALGLSFLHYFTKAWAVPIIGLFSLPRPAKPTLEQTSDVWALFWQSLRPIANASAEWLTWLMGAICILAVVRVLRYSAWLNFHKLLSVVFLGLTLHCVRLMEAGDFFTPFGWLNLLITFAGGWAALNLLISGPGRAMEHDGVLLETVTSESVTRWTIATSLASRIEPGQFVFVKVRGEAHPFSVALVEDDRIGLVIRHAGPFTSGVMPAIPVGERMKFEGPYGAFKPVADGSRQTWVAVGIGIAPFMAWLGAAGKGGFRRGGSRKAGSRRGVTLHWCVRNADKEPLLEAVQALCRDAGVKLVVHDGRHGRADVETLLAEGPERLAVCGGTALSKALRSAWTGDKAKFQEERFAWRTANG